MQKRSDYDFDVISGPSTPPPAPLAALWMPPTPRPPGAAAAPARPVEDGIAGGGKG
jgi:hypothetical protein